MNEVRRYKSDWFAHRPSLRYAIHRNVLDRSFPRSSLFQTIFSFESNSPRSIFLRSKYFSILFFPFDLFPINVFFFSIDSSWKNLFSISIFIYFESSFPFPRKRRSIDRKLIALVPFQPSFLNSFINKNKINSRNIFKKYSSYLWK